MNISLHRAARRIALCALLSCFFIVCSAWAEDGVTDFAASVRLDMRSETLKQEVTVRSFVDGDTTHFNVPVSVAPSGVLKARYLALNTPECTGRIEEYGMKAAAFTRERLSAATSIILESDDDRWNIDSTGSRYLVWVWYKTADMPDYRNLNIEILQNGLAIGYSSAQNRYGSTCAAALWQAQEKKLNVFSGKRDPDFYYGDAIELTLRELRCNLPQYVGKKVAFKGVITVNDGSSLCIEDYDEETGLYFGMSVYYGFNMNGEGLNILSTGNESRIVGTVSYYEAGDAYQVSGLTYRVMRPKDAGNVQKLSDGHQPAYTPLSAAALNAQTMTVETAEGEEAFPLAALLMDTSVEVKGLKVLSVALDDNGEATLACEADGLPVSVRTAPLYDESNAPVNPESLLGKTIDVRGFIKSYHGNYQIKVFAYKAITVSTEQ